MTSIRTNPGSRCDSVSSLSPGQVVFIRTHPLHAWKRGQVLKIGRTRVSVRFMAASRVRFYDRWFEAGEVRIDSGLAQLERASDPFIRPAAARPSDVGSVGLADGADGTCIHGLSGPCPECFIPSETA